MTVLGTEHHCSCLSLVWGNCCLRAEPNGQLAGVLLKVVEDTPEVYNLLVCTLCSCYPISVLGAPRPSCSYPLAMPSRACS